MSVNRTLKELPLSQSYKNGKKERKNICFDIHTATYGFKPS